MIYKVSGNLIMKDGGKIAIDVGGVAYQITLPLSSYSKMPAINQFAEVYTYYVVREDTAALYGFVTLEEKELFVLLNTVSKIGPKVATAILSNCNPNEFAHSVINKDVTTLCTIPGIGKKTAERIILELKDKVRPTGVLLRIVVEQKVVKDDVLSALINLGYRAADCEKIINSLPDDDDFEKLLRKALTQISG